MPSAGFSSHLSAYSGAAARRTQFNFKRSFLGVYEPQMVQFFNVFCIRIFLSLELTFVKVDKGFLQYKIIFCSNFANYMFWICKHKNPKWLIFFNLYRIF